MRWYVSRNGESSGPHEEAEVASWARDGQLAGAMLRDEASPAWVPVEQTPFCGMTPPPLAQTPPNVASPNVSCGVVGLSIVGVLFLAYFWATRDHAPSTPATLESPATAPALPSTPSALDAWVISRQLVKRSLKSPSTAEFGHALSGEYQDPKDHCLPTGDGSWKCVGWVDAQNSFGAKVRSNFSITVMPSADGNWTAISGPTIEER